MQVEIDGARIWFDVVGEGLQANGPEMRVRPTLILVHGGPGGAHGYLKPEFCRLADVAQVIMLDLRGHGRSTGSDRSRWTLAQFGADIRAFCDTLGIVRPYVFGNSFGSLVVQSYAVQHPDHAAGLILSSAMSRLLPGLISQKFAALGGEAAGAAALRFWSPQPNQAEFLACLQTYGRECMHLYGFGPADPDRMMRTGPIDINMLFHFLEKGGEFHTVDYRSQLDSVQTPTLLITGTLDPVCPMECARELVASLPAGRTYLLEAEHCGHPVFADNADVELDIIRWFITGGAASLTVSEAA